jgi:hypothetical protein
MEILLAVHIPGARHLGFDNVLSQYRKIVHVTAVPRVGESVQLVHLWATVKEVRHTADGRVEVHFRDYPELPTPRELVQFAIDLAGAGFAEYTAWDVDVEAHDIVSRAAGTDPTA